MRGNTMDDEYEELHRPHPEHHDHIRRQLKTQLRGRVRPGAAFDLIDHGERPPLDLPQAEYYAFPGAHTITAYPKGTLRRAEYEAKAAEQARAIEEQMAEVLPPEPEPVKPSVIERVEKVEDTPAPVRRRRRKGHKA